MTLTRRLVQNVAFCTGRVSSNNFFSVSTKEVESAGLEAGQDVRVVLFRTDLEGEVKPRDRHIYNSTLQKSNQVYIPADARDKLDLEPGDYIKYIVIPRSAFPGLRDGPLREFVKDNVGASDDDDSQEQERPERETNSAEFTASMQKTGQITIPADVMDRMGLIQGDQVLATVEWTGDELNANKEIGTGNRITIRKAEREKLSLEPGDSPDVRLAVFG